MLHIHYAVLCIVFCAVPIFADPSTTHVSAVRHDGATSVTIEAGSDRGLQTGASVTLLRAGEEIIHPISGQVLGIPQEPVGLAEVRSVEADRATAILVKTYSMPRIGDLVEYEQAESVQRDASAEPEAVAQFIERVRGLENDIKSYQKSQKTLSAYPVFAQQVWDEMRAIKSYLVTLDERLIELEAQQGEDRDRLGQVISGGYRAEDTRELTIRYSEDTDVRLQVVGKTVLISVERDSLHLEQLEEPTLLEDNLVDVESENGETDWYIGYLSDALDYTLGISVIAVGIIALTGIVIFFIKRRYDDVMDGLEDIDQDFAEDDDDFIEEYDVDFDDDESDREYRAR
mgnify:CR=1 FL=1|tara:strand:+ start:910 stop:1941 length:1032 start_codon:yes stop_codon:yes gene_type:complete